MSDSLFLPRATEDLSRLITYLRKKNAVPMVFERLEVRYDSKHDKVNQADPRAFCYVNNEEWFIYCSRSIEDIGPEFRIAILLHEIGHLALNAFKGDISEVDVDTWVLKNTPEAGYHYDDCEYFNIFRQEWIVAKNVEKVRVHFAADVQLGGWGVSR